MDQLWLWALSIVGVAGWYLAGRRNRWGWAIGVFVQASWLVYGVIASRYEFVAASMLYGSVTAINLRSRGRREGVNGETEA